MTKPNESPRLEYAPKLAVQRRRRIYRWIIVIAALISVWRLWDSHDQIIRTVKIAWLKRECIKHPIPPGAIVYSSDDPKAAVHSAEWAALSTVDRPGVDVNGIRADWRSTVFLGELRAGDGTRCLVEVEAICRFEADNLGRVTFYANYSGSNFGGCYESEELIAREQYHGHNDPPKPDILVTSASHDPADPSHITFHFRIFGVERQVDGRYAGRKDFSLAISPEPAR